MTARLITIFTLIIGLGLFAYSRTLPDFKDQKSGRELFIKTDSINKENSYLKQAKFRTIKNPLMDIGSGIAIASGTILLFLLLTNTKTIVELKKIKSFNKIILFVSANLVWLTLIPGTSWYYSFRLLRGDYLLADSVAIVMIPMMMLVLLLIVPMNLFILMTTIKTKLPTKLFVKADHYKTSTIFLEVFFGFWLLLNLFLFFRFVIDGNHVAIFVNLFFTLVLLTIRSGQISKYKVSKNMPEIKYS